MSDPQTPNKFLFTPAHNADIGFWDQPVNANWQGLDQALGTYTTLNANGLNGTIALTTSQVLPLGFIITGTPSGPINYQVPAGVGGVWLTRNRATLGASVTIGFSSASGGGTVTIPAGINLPISADGTANGMTNIDTLPTTAAGGSNNQIQVNIAGAIGAYAGFTFDGSTQHVPNISVDGNAIFGTGAGSTLTINGTAISAPNGFNFNAGAFQMNAGGMLGIGTAPTAALLTIGGAMAITSGSMRWPNGTTQTTAEILQIVTTGVTSPATITGIYPTGTGAAPTFAGGAPIGTMNTTFTPTSNSSTLEIEIIIKGTALGTVEQYVLALFNGSALVDFSAELLNSGGAIIGGITLKTWLPSPGISAQNFTVRLGSNSGAPFGMNQTNNGAAITQLGWISWISIKELMAG